MGRIFSLTLLVVAGCGSNAVDDVAPLDAGFFDSTLAKDGPSLPDAGPPDVAADTTPFNGGGPFLCVDCVCDGTTDLCYLGGGGGAPMADAGSFGDAGDCPADGGHPWCVQVPIQCLPNPTCACLDGVYGAGGCTCSVDPSGSGFVITCPPKP